jgi:HlyD family secretion protein
MAAGTRDIVEPTGSAEASATLSVQVTTELVESNLPLEAIACLAALAIGEGWQSLRVSPLTEVCRPDTGNSKRVGIPYQDQPETFPKIIKLNAQNGFVRDPINKHWALVRREFRARAGRDLLKALKGGDLETVAMTLRPVWPRGADLAFADRYRRIMPHTTPVPARTIAPISRDVEETDHSALRASVRRPMFAGLAVLILLVGAFGGWGATAPLAGGAVASGVISPDGSRRTIQHLEGGIISEIFVRDGDIVAAGAPLLVLEDTQARANHDVLQSQYRQLSASQARLVAEQFGRDSVEFPRELMALSENVEVRQFLDAHRQLFATRREALVSRKRVLEQRIRQTRDQIRGLQAQLASALQRIEIVADELKGKEYLLAQSLIAKPPVLALRRTQAEIEGSSGEYRASIAQAEEQIGQTQMELIALDAVRADEIATELDKVRGELGKVKEPLAASEDKLKRTLVTAPLSGTIVELHFKTRGGVIRPGEPILDIVPAEEELLIDAHVAPTDIDVVYPGLLAQVHLTPYSKRRLPQIEGRVRSVSADSLRDERTGTTYYLARVEVDREQIRRLDKDVQLVPGMPAEVMIVTEERTLFEYLLQPFLDVFRRGLREV